MGYINIDEQREYQRKWYADRRKKFFADKECKICGSTEELELHHKDPSKKISHNIWSWSETKRNLEIAKCIVLCKNHHTNYHASKMRKEVVHGTIAAYKGRHGCRCSECREAVKLHMREYRIKLKSGLV